MSFLQILIFVTSLVTSAILYHALRVLPRYQRFLYTLHFKISVTLHMSLALPQPTNQRESRWRAGLRVQRNQGTYPVGHIPCHPRGFCVRMSIRALVSVWWPRVVKTQASCFPRFSPGPSVGERLQRWGLMEKDLFSRERLNRIPSGHHRRPGGCRVPSYSGD